MNTRDRRPTVHDESKTIAKLKSNMPVLSLFDIVRKMNHKSIGFFSAEAAVEEWKVPLPISFRYFVENFLLENILHSVHSLSSAISSGTVACKSQHPC